MDRFEHFTLSVFGITRYWNKIATKEMKPYGLKGTYALYLVALANAPTEPTAAQLAEMTQRDKADISRAIAAFQAKGIVAEYGKNRYRAPIHLTEKGQVLVDQIRQQAANALQAAGSGLSDDMRQAMYQALDIIADNLKEIYEKDDEKNS